MDLPPPTYEEATRGLPVIPNGIPPPNVNASPSAPSSSDYAKMYTSSTAPTLPQSHSSSSRHVSYNAISNPLISQTYQANNATETTLNGCARPSTSSSISHQKTYAPKTTKFVYQSYSHRSSPQIRSYSSIISHPVTAQTRHTNNGLLNHRQSENVDRDTCRCFFKAFAFIIFMIVLIVLAITADNKTKSKINSNRDRDQELIWPTTDWDSKWWKDTQQSIRDIKSTNQKVEERFRKAFEKDFPDKT